MTGDDDVPRARTARTPAGPGRTPAARPRRAGRAVVAGAALVAASTLGGCAGARGIGAETDADELELEPASAELARVTTDVKAALLAAPDIAAAAIGVRLDGETVRLEGFVDSESERTRALAIARETVPDRDVVDALEVR